MVMYIIDRGGGGQKSFSRADPVFPTGLSFGPPSPLPSILYLFFNILGSGLVKTTSRPNAMRLGLARGTSAAVQKSYIRTDPLYSSLPYKLGRSDIFCNRTFIYISRSKDVAS